MIKSHQRIFQLHSLLSKLLDSLCFQVTVNKIDSNCLSLLQILMWRRSNQINPQQFVQLYKSWLESKSIFDLCTSKQIQCFPKNQFIMNELVQNSFMNVTQITKSLQLLNQAYNKIFAQKKQKSTQVLQKIQRIFSYLDSQGFIHLRLSDIFFLTGAFLIVEKYTIPINYQSFKIHLDDLRKDLCQINGMVSLRSFKNYFLSLNQTKRNSFLDGVVPVFLQFEKNMIGQKGELPNIIDQAFHKWKNFPRFSNNQHESKKKLQVYRRVFEENQTIFFQEKVSIQYFYEKYGEEFINCFEIDFSLLRQFNILIKDSMNRYIDLFSKIGSQSHRSHQTVSHKKSYPTEIYPRITTKSSLRDKTPTKSRKPHRNRTPTHKVHHENIVRRQFESAEKSKDKTYIGRQTTPTKSHRPNSNLYQSYAYSNKKVGPKNGIDKNSFYNKLTFFRNKRVQSFDIVMKRLKGK